MITNLSIGKHGRLGNQFFQYAILKSISLKKNYEIVLPDFSDSFHGQTFLLKKFSLSCKYSKDIKIKYSICESTPNTFREDFLEINDQTSIEGYFQNLKYFDDIREVLIDEFRPNDNYQKKSQEVLKNRRVQGVKLIGIHIRRGDLFKIGFTYDILRTIFTRTYGYKIYGSRHYYNKNTIFGKYFESVKNYYKNQEVKFLVFSGGSRQNKNSIDKKWIDQVFKGLNYEILASEDPILDFEIMKNCDSNVLSFGSSYGWWAAYLNTQNIDKIIAPKNYFFDLVPNPIREMENLFNDKFFLL